MDGIERFLVIMAAFSTASQTLTEHLIKKRWATELDVPMNDLVEENKRQSMIHLYSGIIGTLLAATTGLRPIKDLLSNSSSWFLNLHEALSISIECLLVGVLVSFGGSFFNELLGSLKAFKNAQTEIKKAAETQVAIATASIPTAPLAAAGGAAALPAISPDFDSTLPPLAPAEDSTDVEVEPYPDAPGEDMKDGSEVVS